MPSTRNALEAAPGWNVSKEIKLDDLPTSVRRELATPVKCRSRDVIPYSVFKAKQSTRGSA